jgi:hypothetical protein
MKLFVMREAVDDQTVQLGQVVVMYLAGESAATMRFHTLLCSLISYFAFRLDAAVRVRVHLGHEIKIFLPNQFPLHKRE